MPDTNQKPYTPAMLAARWGCSTSLVYNLLNAGSLAGFRLGTLWRIHALSVEDYESRPPMPSANSPLPTLEDATTCPAPSRDEARARANVARLARLTG